MGRPLITLIILGLIFAFFTWHIQYFKLDASADSLILEGDKDLQALRQVTENYGNAEFLFLSYTPKSDLFSDESIDTLRQIRGELRAIPQVASTTTLIDVPLLKSSDVSLLEMQNNVQTLEKPTVVRELARAEFIESPVYRDLIISADGKTTALQIILRGNDEYPVLLKRRDELRARAATVKLTSAQQQEYRQVLIDYDEASREVDEQRHLGIEAIREVAEKYRSEGKLHLGGVPMIADDMITFIKSDLIVFGVGVFLFLIVTLGVIFRRFRWVLLPLLSCVYAGLLMMGVLGFVGWNVTVISSNFISLMLILTMSMNVHLIVRYRQLCKDQPEAEQRALVLKMARKMVWPCLYTALTTILAFMSLTVSGIKPVIDFGWMMTIGLSVTFLTTFLLFPSILVQLKRSVVPPSEKDDYSFTDVLARFTESRGTVIIGSAVVLAFVAAIGISNLRVENSFINYFDDDTEIYQGMKLIDEQLGGTTPLDILIDVKEPEMAVQEDESFFDMLPDMADFGFEAKKEDTWFTTYKINTIKAVHDYLDSQPEIGKVLSLAAPVRVAEDLNDGQPLDSLALAIMYQKVPVQLRTEMIDPYIDIDRDEARINLRVKDSLPDLRRKELIERINRDLHKEVGLEKDQYRITGMLVLYNNMLQSLFTSQIETLGTVMLGIFIMLLILFRSFKLAIIGILPNILSALLILGIIGLLGIPLDMMTITIAAITIGIAVDNAIHYIYRFREEFPRQGMDYLRTLHYCHANIGKAVFYTAVTIIVGFSILVLSNFIPTIYFGLFTALAMAIALLAALTLLPRLILITRPF
ncbi:MAG: MMPL family transporter [Gammaproteobacteria bacterium]|nr:MMPL family transporter [Gammaproteobacteria bacterium]